MKSPVDNSVEMKKVTKFGIEIEYCPISGGVWLDKGELEKLIQVVEERQSHKYDAMAPQIDDSDTYLNSYSTEPAYYQKTTHKYKKRKESILGEIFDIF